MKKEEIDRLLERYYAGQTTEEEEDGLLQALQSTNDLPADLQAERDLFLCLHPGTRNEIPVPDDLEAGLAASIDRKASATRHCRLWWSSVAASLLLLVGLGFGIAEIRQDALATTPQDTFTNPEDAHRALQAIFTEMSRNWNEGMEQLEASQQDIMAASRRIREEFE